MLGRIFTLRRLTIAALCVTALAGSCLLAWWQWTRYESGGSLQNLGYVLQWPLFGLFPAFMVWRIHRLATQGRRETPAEPAPKSQVPSVAPSRLGYVAPRRAAEDEPDPVLAEYNRYLAELNEKTSYSREDGHGR
ncbi:MAG: hypothetical protein ACRDQ5_20630 [Sciscionella sp.]